MITADPIARVIEALAAEGHTIGRASDLIPEATAGVISGESMREGTKMKEATAQWEVGEVGAGWQCISFEDAFGQHSQLFQSNLIDDTIRAMENPGSSCLRLGLKDSQHGLVLHRTHVAQLVEVMQRWLDTYELKANDKHSDEEERFIAWLKENAHKHCNEHGDC